MGAITSNSAIYLTISDGKVCRRVQSPTTKSKERTNKEGRVVHEEFYAGWSGKIIDIKTRESEYGKDWQIHLEDEDGIAILSMKYSSGYAASFLKALPNVDLTENVQLTPKMTVEGEKKKTTMFINQGGKSVKWAFTKENPNGIPSLKKIKIKGVEQWDDSDLMEFLEEMVKNQILPKVKPAEDNDVQEDVQLPF